MTVDDRVAGRDSLEPDTLASTYPAIDARMKEHAGGWVGKPKIVADERLFGRESF